MDLLDLYAKLSLDTSDYEQRLSAVENKTKSSGGTLGKVMSTAGKVIAGGIAAGTAGVVAFAKSSACTGMEFDTAMSQVAATMGVTTDEISDLTATAKTMGATTQFTATQSAEALNYLALAGYDAETSAKTLPTVLNLAAAGAMDLGSASDMVTDAMSAFGLGADYAETMVDQMAKTASSSNTSVSQLGEAMLQIGATGKSVAGGTVELSTALGILADNGVKGAEGGTHLRNIIMSLQSPTDKASKLMESLGIQVYDSDGKMRPLNDTLNDLNAAMDGMTNEQRDGIINQIFNKTDIASVNALLANSGDRWNELSEAIENSGGAAAQMAETQMDNLEGSMTYLSSATDGLKLAFYNTFSDKAKSGVDSVTAGVTELTEAMESDGIDGFIDKLGELVPGAVQALVSKLPQLISVGMKLTGHILQGVLQAAPTLASGMVTIAGQLVSSLLQGLPQMWQAGLQLINNLSDGIGQNITKVINQGLPIIAQFSGNIRQSAGQLIDAGLNLIMNIAQGLIDGIPALVQNVPIIVENIAGIINDNAPKVLATGVAIIGQLVMGLIKAIPSIVKAIPSIIKAIVSVITAFNWLNLGKQIITGLANGIKAMVGGVQTVAGSIKDTVVNAIKNLPQTLKNLATQAVNWFKSAFGGGGILSAVSGAIKGIPGAFKNIMGSALSALKSGVKNLVGALKFSWSLPKLKLPHISVDGGKAPFGIGGAGSLPKFSIKWYKKAEDNAFELNQATIFGAMGGSLLGGGEGRGSEILIGKNKLLSTIREATGGTGATYNITMNIYGAVGQDVNELARIIEERLALKAARKEAVWA